MSTITSVCMCLIAANMFARCVGQISSSSLEDSHFDLTRAERCPNVNLTKTEEWLFTPRLPLSVLFGLQRSRQQEMRISGGVLVTTLLLVQLTQAYGFCTPQFSAAWSALHQPAAGARQASRR